MRFRRNQLVDNLKDRLFKIRLVLDSVTQYTVHNFRKQQENEHSFDDMMVIYK